MKTFALIVACLLALVVASPACCCAEKREAAPEKTPACHCCKQAAKNAPDACLCGGEQKSPAPAPALIPAVAVDSDLPPAGSVELLPLAQEIAAAGLARPVPALRWVPPARVRRALLVSRTT